jgi:hypothetical protein
LLNWKNMSGTPAPNSSNKANGTNSQSNVSHG